MENNSNNNRFDEIFRKAKDINISAPPFMKTRIMAELRLRKKEAPLKALLFWKRLAIASIATSFLIVVGIGFIFLKPQVGDNGFIAEINKPVSVKVELANLSEDSIRIAEIDLPEGVTFYSNKYPELNAKRQLRLALNGKLNELPFIIKSQLNGIKQVKVRFLDGNEKLVEEKIISINFKGEGKII